MTARQLLINLVAEDMWIANDYSEVSTHARLEAALLGHNLHSYDVERIRPYRPIYLKLTDQGVTRLINETIRKAKAR